MPMTPRAGAPLAALLGILVLAGGVYGVTLGAAFFGLRQFWKKQVSLA